MRKRLTSATIQKNIGVSVVSELLVQSTMELSYSLVSCIRFTALRFLMKFNTSETTILN